MSYPTHEVNKIRKSSEDMDKSLSSSEDDIILFDNAMLEINSKGNDYDNTLMDMEYEDLNKTCLTEKFLFCSSRIFLLNYLDSKYRVVLNNENEYNLESIKTVLHIISTSDKIETDNRLLLEEFTMFLIELDNLKRLKVMLNLASLNVLLAEDMFPLLNYLQDYFTLTFPKFAENVKNNKSYYEFIELYRYSGIFYD